MNLSYKIEESDYLIYQLYSASKTKSVRRKRMRTWLILPIVYLLFAVSSYIWGRQEQIAILFGGLSVLWFVTYPFYSRWLYKDHYRKHIRRTNKEMFGREVKLSIDEHELVISDHKNKSLVDLSEIEKMTEIQNHIFIKLKPGASVIIPKESVSDLNALVQLLTVIAKKNKLQLTKDLDWKWR